MQIQFIDSVAAGMVAVALAAVTYLAVVQGNHEAGGALIGVVAAGVGFFLRGRVQSPGPSDTAPTNGGKN